MPTAKFRLDRHGLRLADFQSTLIHHLRVPSSLRLQKAITAPIPYEAWSQAVTKPSKLANGYAGYADYAERGVCADFGEAVLSARLASRAV